MPDKAIDLVDEAASRLKMQIDSRPEPIDQLERRLTSLAIEEQALGKEKDEASAKRLAEVAAEIAELRERVDQMKTVWQHEKEVIGALRKLKEEIEAAKTEAELAQRRGDLNRAAELRFGRMPELEKAALAKADELKQAQAARLVPARGGHRGGRRGGGLEVDRHPGRQDAGGRAGASSCTWRNACTRASSARTRR